ncbi:FAD:protein FMN transferase [Shewanella colwelliana]|nr:FAD:protein FMN transferase [Shewanella colwelliana]
MRADPPSQITSQSLATKFITPSGHCGKLTFDKPYYRITFSAMASQCECLIESTSDGDDSAEITCLAMAAIDEVKRIESKYNRFDVNSQLSIINAQAGKWQQIDEETIALMDFAAQCYQLSQGRFDVTAGSLMALWKFELDGTSIPNASDIGNAIKRVGFDRIQICDGRLLLPQEMMLDFGGLAKEYAADRAALVLLAAQAEQTSTAPWQSKACLINLGGDLVVTGTPTQPWQVGIEDPSALNRTADKITISSDAIATSGHSRRFIEDKGERFGHIIDPTTGMPVLHAPLSVTVCAPQCISAGMLATMAMLQGKDAEQFLSEQGLVYKVIR